MSWTELLEPTTDWVIGDRVRQDLQVNIDPDVYSPTVGIISHVSPLDIAEPYFIADMISGECGEISQRLMADVYSGPGRPRFWRLPYNG